MDNNNPAKGTALKRLEDILSIVDNIVLPALSLRSSRLMMLFLPCRHANMFFVGGH
jgi:hypothetical protein